ncbi:YetF domain-containing protein [Fonticella tunisiensis]|uniref:Uncharacterized membrane protein YcaP (DUF421 family) n=1 Tax=Fonticella tunisiensis TaxID=1096341 RepID=A0A4R7KL26_9CLOT|nr:DUF421 domain-containing protein [Fonticella tunisiensis]TDT57250.1 uncharacterized membrane protein YcaP (DUF421 family) [Fonticella tunisiensis]
MFEPLNITIRVLLAIVLLFTSTRLLNKRSLSNLTYFDFVASSLLGTIAGNLAFNLRVHILNFILSIFLVTVIILLVSYISLKFRPFRRFVAGHPAVIIHNGKILERNMKCLNYSFDYLTQQLREEKIFDIGQVKSAVLEPDGKLSIQLKSKNRPLTPKDLNLTPQKEFLAAELILDGEIIENNLRIRNVDNEWLINELKKKGVNDVKNVAFAAIGSNGNLYVDLYRD